MQTFRESLHIAQEKTIQVKSEQLDDLLQTPEQPNLSDSVHLAAG